MCIAIAKRAGVACPSLETLHNCWDSNPDGAGFAFNNNGVVLIKKGYMTWDTFKTAWEKYSKMYDFNNRGVLIHFRISTHGGTNPQNTHPFPVLADTGMMQKPECVCDYAAIHNGIIHLTSSKATQERTTSDTLVFIRDYLSLIAQNKAWFKRRANIELIDELIDAPSSKMAILNGRGEIIYTNGFTEDNGVLYSNTSYKVARVRSSKSYNNYTYYAYDYPLDDDDDFGYGYGYGYNGYAGSSYYQNGKKSKFKATPANVDADRVPLMRCDVTDTIRSDSYEDIYIDSYADRNFVVSEEGYLYEMLEDSSTGTHYDDDDYVLQFVGSGCFIDRMNRAKDFVPNFYADEGQFLSESYPDNLNALNDYADDDAEDFEEDVDFSKKKEADDSAENSETETAGNGVNTFTGNTSVGSKS